VYFCLSNICRTQQSDITLERNQRSNISIRVLRIGERLLFIWVHQKRTLLCAKTHKQFLTRKCIEKIESGGKEREEIMELDCLSLQQDRTRCKPHLSRLTFNAKFEHAGHK